VNFVLQVDAKSLKYFFKFC